ncbi:MAG: hypothetical protein PHU71_05510 [Candidatus Gracilibacteria bacterium]|nr:hypothetical protein [Candidatus Gracilibacteria bacterium]
MLKKTIILIVIVVLLILLFLRFLSPEDTWICEDGQWIQHGVPDTPMPGTACN